MTIVQFYEYQHICEYDERASLRKCVRRASVSAPQTAMPVHCVSDSLSQSSSLELKDLCAPVSHQIFEVRFARRRDTIEVDADGCEASLRGPSAVKIVVGLLTIDPAVRLEAPRCRSRTSPQVFRILGFDIRAQRS